MKNLRCDPALFEKDLQGTITIVTGANSGTGLATVEQLVRQGAHVVAACRRVQAGQEAVAHLQGEKGEVEVMELDLASLASVRAFVQAFGDKHDRLDALVNNAGVMNTPEGQTIDGFETQFGVNCLSPPYKPNSIPPFSTGGAQEILAVTVSHGGAKPCRETRAFLVSHCRQRSGHCRVRHLRS
jgi:NAD(P)-dependent dehydrogenase (short-subunit alcohol dehydrogenase family)